MKRGIRPHCLVAALAAASLACSDDPPPPPAPFEVTDSAGISIAWSPAPGDPTPRALGEPTVTMGDDSIPLNDVVGAVTLSDGRLVVADGGDAMVRVFSPEGVLLGSVGGPGDGPSEFRILESIGSLPGDTVWAYDFSHNRLTVIAPDLSIARTVTLHPPPGPARAVGVDSTGGTVLGEAWSSSRLAEATQPGLHRTPVAYLRYGPEGVLADTLTEVSGREVVLGVEDGRTVMGSAPLGRNAVHAFLTDRFAVGDQSRHEVRLYDLAGRLRRLVRWEGGDLRLTEIVATAWRTSRLESLPPAERARAERQLAEQELPARLPAYGELLPTPDGGLWVGAFAPDGRASSSWAVFDASGRWLGTVTTPPRFRVLEVTEGRVLGVSRDALDVQRLEARSFERFAR